MTPEEIPEVIKIVARRLPKCGIHRIGNKDIMAMLIRIIFERADITKNAAANKIVEECRSDYVNFRQSEKIPGTKKYKTRRCVRIGLDDYLSVRDGADDDNTVGAGIVL